MTTQFPLAIALGVIDKLSGPLTRIEGKFGKFGKAATAAGKRLTFGITAPTIALGAVALSSFAEYESGMLRVQALTGATAEQQALLEDQSKSLGATTVFTAGQVAGAQGFLAQAGFEVNEVMSATPGILNLASAAQMEVAETADIASNILTGYGKSAEQIDEVGNVLVRTFTQSNVSLEQLGESMKIAGPVAAAMNLPMEETAAILGKMGDAGFQASLGGTAVRGALAKLAVPSREAVETLTRLGISRDQVLDSEGNVRSLIGVVELLGEKGATAGDILTVFGQRAGPAMAALVGQGADSIRELEARLHDGTTAGEIADTMMSGVAGRMALLRSAADGLGRALLESGILEWFTQTVEGATNLITRLSEANPQLLKLAAIAIVAAAAVGPLLIIVGQAALGIQGLTSAAQFLLPLLATTAKVLTTTVIPAVWSFTTALLANPIGAVVAAVIALIGGLVLLAQKNETVKNALLDAWEFLTDLWLAWMEKIIQGVKAVAWVFQKLGTMVGFEGPDDTLAQRIGLEAIPDEQLASVATGATQVQRQESRVEIDFRDLPQGTRVTTDGLAEEVELALGFALEGAG